MSKPAEQEIKSKIETGMYLLGQRKAVFQMAQYYWNALKMKPVVQEIRVANLASAWAIDAIPFALALEGKSRYDLMTAVKAKPEELKVKVQNYEIDSRFINIAVGGDPFMRSIAPRPYSFVRADIRELPIADNTQDIVLIRNPNWKYQFTPKEIDKVYDEIERVLKPGGFCWSTHVLARELAVSYEHIESKGFKRLVLGPNKYPSPTREYISSETGETVKVRFDAFVLIAKKVE